MGLGDGFLNKSREEKGKRRKKKEGGREKYRIKKNISLALSASRDAEL